MQLTRAKQALQSLVRRWRGVPPQDRERVEAELGEILVYLIRAANRVGIELEATARKGIPHDARPHPGSVAAFRPSVVVDALAADQAPCILIVEDERIVAADLQEVLNGLGYDAYAVAASGAEALAIARSKRPDIVLMDIRIDGDVDGIEVATQLRREFDTAVIFVTALADTVTVQRAKSADPCAYLIKPVTVPALKTSIELTACRQRTGV
jgi:CheY-like chemotaxis protein